MPVRSTARRASLAPDSLGRRRPALQQAEVVPPHGTGEHAAGPAELAVGVSLASFGRGQGVKALAQVAGSDTRRPIQIDGFRSIIHKELHIQGVWGRRLSETWAQAEAFIHQWPDKISLIVTARYPLSDGAAAIERALGSAEGETMLIPWRPVFLSGFQRLLTSNGSAKLTTACRHTSPASRASVSLRQSTGTPHDYVDYPYIEWYGDDNGRAVIELAPSRSR